MKKINPAPYSQRDIKPNRCSHKVLNPTAVNCGVFLRCGINKKNFVLLVIFFLSFIIFYSAKADNGSGTSTISPVGVVAGSDGNELIITFRAKEDMENGQLKITIPVSLSRPTNIEGQRGYTKASSSGQIGNLNFFQQDIIISLISLKKNNTVVIDFGVEGGNNGFLAARGAINSEIRVYSQINTKGTLTLIENSPVLLVQSAGGRDIISPVSKFTNLSENQIIASEDFLIQGTAVDYGGSLVGDLKISFDNGLNWENVSSIGSYFSTWQYNWQSIPEGHYDIKIKARDFIGNWEASHGFQVEINRPPSEEVIEEEIAEEEAEEEIIEEETASEEEITLPAETPGGEMTVEELKAKIVEIQQKIVQLLNQLIQLIRQQIAEI